VGTTKERARMKILIEIETVEPQPKDLKDLTLDIKNDLYDTIDHFGLVQIIKPIKITTQD
jgi:hypothetical protein